MNMERRDLVKGEVYVGHWRGGVEQVIFVAPEKAHEETFFINTKGEFNFQKCCTGPGIEFRHATGEEKLRLLTLIQTHGPKLLEPSNEGRRKLVTTVYKNCNPAGQEALQELFPDIRFISKEEAEQQLGKIIID